MRWKSGGFLVLFKGEGCSVSPRFYLFVFDINQGNKRQDGFKKFCVALGMERIFLHILQVVRNMVYPFEEGSGGV